MSDDHVSTREKLHDKAAEEVSVHGHGMHRGDIFKFVGLLAFFAIMAAVCFVIWPYIKDIFEPGGLEALIDRVQSAGMLGVFFLLALEFLQVVVAFVPGEVVQVAAGMMYGPWLGAIIILIGCIISSGAVFMLAHKLGAPFVQAMVPMKYLEKIRHFEKSGKLHIIIFILFLIPGLPKDVFTYLVPLTSMRMSSFLILSNIGRIPGIIVSTYAAGKLMEGHYEVAIMIFAIAAVIALLGVVFRDKIMHAFGKEPRDLEEK